MCLLRKPNNVVSLNELRSFDSDNVVDMGASGYYWSLSINTQNSVGAWAILLDDIDPFRYVEYRNWGLSVRPVTE